MIGRACLGVLLVLLSCTVGGDLGEAVNESALGSARQAQSVLDAGTADAAAPVASNDCCTTSSTSGCSDRAVLACVCQGDAFCCSDEYDGVCVTQAQSLCGLSCDPRPPESDCCAPSDVPGCTRPEVQACICDIDPFCCIFRFDDNCVNLAAARCAGACGEVSP